MSRSKRTASNGNNTPTHSETSANVSKPEHPLFLYVFIKVEVELFDALIENVRAATGAYPHRVRREAAATDENQWSVKCKGELQYNALKRKPFIWHREAHFWHTEQQTIVYSLIVWPLSDKYEHLVVPELNKVGKVIGIPESVTRRDVDTGHISCIVEIGKTKEVPTTLTSRRKKIAEVCVNSNDIICGTCLMICAGPNCCRSKTIDSLAY